MLNVRTLVCFLSLHAIANTINLVNGDDPKGNMVMVWYKSPFMTVWLLSFTK